MKIQVLYITRAVGLFLQYPFLEFLTPGIALEKLHLKHTA